jgi:spore maturation protein CgeB
MLTIVYSFNKRGFEAEYWQREIAAASDDEFRFVPFNHDPYLDPMLYIRAQLLDNVYYDRHPGLGALYETFDKVVRDAGADAVIVDTCPPYHPDYLQRQPYYKVLRIADGPLSAYDRDFAYLHAYDHVLYHSPAYSRDMDMREKLAYCGARRADFWPLALFDAAFDPDTGEDQLLAGARDIDVVFVGALHVNKMPLLARVKKALGARCRLHGLTSFKRNVYFNVKHGFPGWIRPIASREYVPLYRRAKIGFNVHNRGDYTVGSYRLFELPANGVMQLSDGGRFLEAFFETGREIVGYRDADDLIDKLTYYLEHDDERVAIARAGYRRVMRDHRIRDRLREAGRLVRDGMEQKRVARDLQGSAAR